MFRGRSVTPSPCTMMHPCDCPPCTELWRAHPPPLCWAGIGIALWQNEPSGAEREVAVINTVPARPSFRTGVASPPRVHHLSASGAFRWPHFAAYVKSQRNNVQRKWLFHNMLRVMPSALRTALALRVARAQHQSSYFTD